MSLTIETLKESIEDIKKTKPKIAVIGDLILDEYLVGYPERISREAPVLILEYKENYYRLGGAANAAINAAHLGADVTLIGAVGIDDAAKVIQDICHKNKITLKTVEVKDQPTTLKTRILSTNQGSSLSHAGTSSTQQVLRIDKLSRNQLEPNIAKQLSAKIKDSIAEVDVLLLSDYQLGVLTDEVIKELMNLGKKIVVDPSTSFERFDGAFLITPNQPDTEKVLETKVDLNDSKGLNKAKKQLKAKLPNVDNFLVTRGADGMALFQATSVSLIPAFNKAEVFDVSGAGDTVSACVTVAIATGKELPTCMALGNLAASIVVRKLGTATTNLNEMKEALEDIKNIECKSIKLN